MERTYLQALMEPTYAASSCEHWHASWPYAQTGCQLAQLTYASVSIRSDEMAVVQVAALIHSLQLERNGATLLLSNLLDEEDGDDDALTRPASKVRDHTVRALMQISRTAVQGRICLTGSPQQPALLVLRSVVVWAAQHANDARLDCSASNVNTHVTVVIKAVSAQLICLTVADGGFIIDGAWHHPKQFLEAHTYLAILMRQSCDRRTFTRKRRRPGCGPVSLRL